MDEILVHIAAPSTAHDDARYRAQVAAILDFQHTHSRSRPESPRDSLQSLISVIPDSQDQHGDLLETEFEPVTGSASVSASSPAEIYTSLLSLPWEIHPPKPPVSTASFQSHVTSTLAMLTERLKPERTYIPSSQTRSLHPLERGYWFVRFNITDRERANADITSPMWPSPLFRSFWSFLSDFIGRDGRAGWGVWCVLEPDGVLTSGHPVTLKVYAWGEIIMHVYLLLFLASDRRIRGMGAQWKDSREEVVVQMP